MTFLSEELTLRGHSILTYLVGLSLWGQFARLPGFLMRETFQGTVSGPVGRATEGLVDQLHDMVG